nr:hypothetical protein [Mycoplasmopsis canis]WQQ12484.1 hypothetical protein RRG48_00340 [Mycoplasmopsis canis]
MKNSFFKRNKNKFLLSFGVLAGLSLLTFVLGMKFTKKFKPSFYNYKSYMSEDNIKEINNTFDYKEFDEVNQFSNALINNKAVAGIGSEFLAVELIRKQLIGKIDYASLLNLPEIEGFLEFNKLKSIINSDNFENYHESQKNNFKKLFKEAKQKRDLARKYVQLTLRSEIWDHLSKYKLENGDELWEYFYPYFSQDMVIGYNIKKIPLDKEVQNEDGGINIDVYKNSFKNTDIQDPLSLINVLKIMSKNNFDKWYITDAVRDNMLYGSSYWPLPNGRTENNFTGKVSDSEDYGNQTYKILIDAFADLIHDGTGYDIKNNKHITFKGDGLEIVNDLINPGRPDVNVAIMYNGDAIDSYYGSDNFPDVVEDGEIRAIKPKNNILLLDGFVVSSGASRENAKQYTKAVSNTIFQGNKEIIDSYKELVEKNLLEEKISSNTSDSNFNKIQTKVAFKRILSNWSEAKKIEISKEIDEADDNIEVLINKYSSIIDLSSLDNSDKLQEYFEVQKKYKNNENYEYDDRINIFVKFFSDYISKNLSSFIDFISDNFKKEDFKIESLSERTIETNLFSAWLNKDRENILSFISELNDKSELVSFFTTYIARKISFIDISSLEDKHNFTNFDFVNYVPTNISDYEQVLQNYFLDPIEGHDANAISLFEITNANGIVHENIQPVSDELQSKLTTYYFNKTKS